MAQSQIPKLIFVFFCWHIKCKSINKYVQKSSNTNYNQSPALTNDDNKAKNSSIMCFSNGQVNFEVALLWACQNSNRTRTIVKNGPKP